MTNRPTLYDLALSRSVSLCLFYQSFSLSLLVCTFLLINGFDRNWVCQGDVVEDGGRYIEVDTEIVVGEWEWKWKEEGVQMLKRLIQSQQADRETDGRTEMQFGEKIVSECNMQLPRPVT